MVFSMASLDLGLGAFVGASSRPPSLDCFSPRLYFSKLDTELFASHYTKYLFFVPPLHLDGYHQGYIMDRETTHDEYL
jgi:hypothetical protein